jgi:DNA polymerase III epsilon subunit-like protein
MGYIAWDTETSGKPPSISGEVTPENYHLFSECRMASIAAVTFSRHGRELSSYHSLVYPNGFRLGMHDEDTLGATHIHKIKHVQALRDGLPFMQVYDKFVDIIKRSRVDTLVAHNSDFDKNVLFSECYRYGLSIEPFKHLKFICTLELSRGAFLDTPNYKLETIYKYITGDVFRAHDALEDSRACGVVYSVVRDINFNCRDIGVDKISIDVSDIPAIIGKIWFTKPVDLAKSICASHIGKTAMGADRERIIEQIASGEPFVRVMINTARQFQSRRTRDLEMKLNAIKVQLISKCHLGKSDLTQVFSYISDILYSKLTVREYTQLDKRECTHPLFTICGTGYELHGRVGDIINDEIGMTILGAKEYTERVNTTLSGADVIRSQVLMQMLDIDTCRFETSAGVINITRDHHAWKYEIEPKLRRFCEYVHSRISKPT